MAEQREQQQAQDTGLAPDDLNLVDDHLEDENKDDAELWQEFDHAESATATDPDDDRPADEPGGAVDQEGDGAHAADDGQGSSDGSADGDGSSDDALRANGQSDGQQPSDDASNRQQAQDDAQLWANATPEQRAAHEAAQAQLRKLEQAERSNRGRLSAMQRQMNDLMAKGQPSQKAAPGGAAQEQRQEQGQDGGDANAEGFLASDEWKSFQEEYPEVAGPLAKVVGGLQAHTTRLEKELSAIGDERRQFAMDEQTQLLAADHPDWEHAVADRGFSEWLHSQPRHIQEAAYRNANEIVDAAEAADVVGRFKDHVAAAQGGGNNARPNNAQAGNGQGNGNNRALSGKRQRQLESASTTRSRGPSAATGIPEDGDPEVIWRQFDEMERRQARA